MRNKLRGRFYLLFSLAFVAFVLAVPAVALAQNTGSSSASSTAPPTAADASTPAPADASTPAPADASTPAPTTTDTSSATPTIQSDKEDYYPGELVTLTGSNWQPGEVVRIVVDDDGVAAERWQRDVEVTADENGNIRDEFNLPEWFVKDFSVTATGALSGTATTTFTDSTAFGGCPGSNSNTPTTINVTTTADEYNTSAPLGACSLREAIRAANGDSAHDTINLLAGTYTLTRSGTDDGAPTTNGDLDIVNQVTINGPEDAARTTIIQAGPTAATGIDRVLHVQGGNGLTLNDVTVQNGRVSGADGGGILTSRPLTLSEVTIKNNQVTSSDRNGGGISHQGELLTISQSTISGNTATGRGGGLHSTSGTANLTNVTITDENNAATGGANKAATGGGIFNSGSNMTLVNVTVSHNEAPTGSNITRSSGTISLRNTIVSDGVGGNNCSGAIVNTANNLDSGSSCNFTTANNSKSSANANLGDLQNNGGPTDTRALGAGSAAIDAGVATFTTTPTSAPNVDQRGVSRPQGSAHDIGAFELQPPTTYTLSVAKAGAGSGTVTSSPAGIECGSDCSESYNDGESVTLTANASGSTFASWSGGNGTVNANGTYTVTMSEARSVTATFKANQTINFTSTAPSNAVIGDTYEPSASGGGSNNPVTFGASGACSYDSGTGLVTMDSAGSCTVTADQAGNANYNAASQASQVFSVANHATAISAVSGSGTYGDTATLTATLEAGSTPLSGKTVSFELNGTAVGTADTDDDGVATLTGVSLSDIDAGSYPDAVRADFAGGSGYEESSGQGTLKVAKAEATLTFADGTLSQEYNGSPRTVSVITDPTGLGSDVSVTYNGSETAPTNAGNYTVRATLTNGNYEAAPIEDTLVVAKVAGSVSISNLPSTAAFGGSFTPAYDNAGDGVASTIPKTESICSVNNSGVVSFDAPGTCTLQASVTEGTNHSAATGAEQNFQIGAAATATTVQVTPSSQQYSDLVTLTANLTGPGSPTGTVQFKINNQNVGSPQPLSGGSASLSNYQVTQAPGTYSVTAVFTSTNPTNWNNSTSTAKTLTVTKEVATAGFNGPLFYAVPSGNATVTLSAVITDDADGSRGDIRNATVNFVNRDTGATLCTATNIVLLTPGDTTTGVATCNVPDGLPFGTGDSTQYTVGIIVNGYYTRNSPADNTVVTVSKAVNGMITGGGYLVNEKSFGQYAGTAGQKTNFGFNVKYNKSLTSLQGNINTIIRSGGKVYQIKGNAMSSLTTNLKTATAKTATFNGKANLRDITNPLAPVSLGGNLPLQVTMTDRGEPGSSDTIGIQLSNTNGSLLFSSNWSGTKTVEQLLKGGNLVVR